MLKFYFHPSPNPAKVALYLEEAGLPYELVPVDVRKGEQHSPAYLAINPNGKTPALQDGDATVFDSNAILLYLAVKTGKFLPRNQPEIRAQMYSWLMFIATGVGPFSGQAVHFRHFAPEPKAYAQQRYDFEAARHWRIINAHLATRTWMVGEEYTIVDMALWAWARAVPMVLGNDAWAELPHVQRFLDMVSARPAAVRAEALADAHKFKTEMDQAAMDAMYPHTRQAV
ncbi:MAG: glutathione S-transferase family protein [Rhodoferax sp.]|nr:glutathione S-transferase family protein [Rhodoferax sp.]MDP3654143.1 glutathione S-transferase family protein [Rhodoferax sp.]